MAYILRCASVALALGLSGPALADEGPQSVEPGTLEEITIVGTPADLIETAGAAHVVDAERLAQFAHADIQRIIRDVPGVSVQVEDGYGLRPNLSIRGTASERSGRITLLEDNILIAPAPYSAPSAYYFPTSGRMSQVEVLKGSSAIRQGPYTVGGAMNFISTPIPDVASGFARLEYGEDETTRLHTWYGNQAENIGWLVEGHLWDSAGYQDIDGVGGDTGLDKDDWTVKLRLNSNPSAQVHQQFDIKLQLATESSNQSYLGLTDGDFDLDPYRRYAVSQLDNIETEHDQVILRYGAQFDNGITFTATGYSNNHERDWFKTEGVDTDGSASAADFARTSWFDVVQAVNSGSSIGALGTSDLQAILDGGDTAAGAIQLRNNARKYFSRGIQLGLDIDRHWGNTEHNLEIGVRFHEDEEDRLQRNSTYTLIDGVLVLNDAGERGNAGNRIQKAEAISFHVHDEISAGNWILTPGIRYEDIDQSRIRYETRAGLTADPSSRADTNIRDTRSNKTGVLIPGFGALYMLNDDLAVYGGIHKGFTAPSNAPDVDEEASVNYEFGIRYNGRRSFVDAAAFYTDYDNILGECTSSSGADCDIGDAFNGDAASIFGVELALTSELSGTDAFSIPLTFSYTFLKGEFDSDIADTDFFGSVSAGDPLPYVPENQFAATLGLEQDRFATFVSANYVDDSCVRASCGPFEKTDATLVFDLSAHYELNESIAFYGRLDNVTGEEAIAGRQPYGARPNRDRTFSLGALFSL